MPIAFVDLLTDYECSHEEWELIINLYQVLPPSAVLSIIEQIPAIGDSEYFPTFTLTQSLHQT